MEIFEVSKKFPKEEQYSLTDQIRRSSRSVTTCIGESWSRRRYIKSFVNKLVDALGEENETEVWLDYSEYSGLYCTINSGVMCTTDSGAKCTTFEQDF
jgi:four helix bundle protein